MEKSFRSQSTGECSYRIYLLNRMSKVCEMREKYKESSRIELISNGASGDTGLFKKSNKINGLRTVNGWHISQIASYKRLHVLDF